MSAPLRACIIGLGQIAWQFDVSGKRGVVWTHLGAYRAFGEAVSVVGACDPSDTARNAFSGYAPGVRVYERVADMMAACNPQVVSICTPAGTHGQVLSEVVKFPSVRAVWCEKPLAPTLAEAEQMVEACRARDVPLVVSHVRRWTPLWRRVRDVMANGELGTIRSLRVAMPNRLFSIGSHAVDLAMMLGGRVDQVAVIDIPTLHQDGEPARSALLAFENGISGSVLVTGRKDRLVVDVEVIGDSGHLYAREDDGSITRAPFEASKRFEGYFERGQSTVEHLPTMSEHSPFLGVCEEIISLARGEKVPVTCSGEDALLVAQVLDQLANAPSLSKT